MTLSFAGEKQEAIDALQKAICFESAQSLVYGEPCQCLLQAQDFDHAIPLLQELQTSTSLGLRHGCATTATGGGLQICCIRPQSTIRQDGTGGPDH